METLLHRFRIYVRHLTGHLPALVDRKRAPLPGYLSVRFEPHAVVVDGQTWLAALLKQPEAPPPLSLQKQLLLLQAKWSPAPNGTCLVAEHLPPYLRKRLIELGQPFVIPGRQLFWPALGSAETTQRPKRLSPEAVERLSPVAQQLLIALLLNRLLAPVTISGAAEALGYAAASISQAVRALEGSQLVCTQAQGRERSFALRDAPRQTWDRAQELLGSPIGRRIRVKETELPTALALPAGETALADLTNLAAPEERVYAAASRSWPKGPDQPATIPTPDAGTCVVELWRYPPEVTASRGTIDPLSLWLSLRDSKDERVQLALQELLEQQPW